MNKGEALDGLIVIKEYLDLILSGKKTWELRGKRCHKRGKIALIQSKSGTVVGTAELVDCIGPLTLAEYNRNIRKSRGSHLRSKDEFYYETTYAWVLKNPRKLKRPIRYRHKQGAVVWHPVKV